MGRWFWSMAAILLALAGCGSDATPTRQNNLTPLTSLVITSTIVTLPAGTSAQLSAVGNFSGLFSRDITNQVIWSSDQPGIADFLFPALTPGRVKGLVPGEALITATLGTISASANLIVSDATLTALALSPLGPSQPLGFDQAFTAIGTFSDGLLPPDLTADVIWSSSDPAVASISNDPATKGIATALKVGTTTISAQFDTTTGSTLASTLFTVTPATLQTIALSPANATLLSLASRSFTARGTFSDNSSRDVTTEVVWSVDDQSFAAVTTASNVKALKPGSTTIRAVSGSVNGTASLRVTGGTLTTIAVTVPLAVSNVLVSGTTSRIIARGTFSDGNNSSSRDITGAVVPLTNPDITSVHLIDGGGNLQWVQGLVASPGVVLTAGVGSVSGQVTLAVRDDPLSSVSILQQNLFLSTGTTGELTLAGLFLSASSQDLTPVASWSSNAAAVSVGNLGLNKGRVTALAAGSSLITATYDGKPATAMVTVVERTLSSLTLAPVTPLATIFPGVEIPYRLTAVYSDGFTQDVTADALWSVDNANIAVPADVVVSPGVIVAVDVGTTTVNATFGAQRASKVLVVSPP